MPGFASDLPKMWYVIGDEDSFRCLNATSDPPQQEQNDQDQKDQSDSAAGIGSPGPTVAPGGQGADEQDDQDDNKDNSHDIPPLLFFLLIYRGMGWVSNATVAAGSWRGRA
jgi:hypothetical protein